MAGGSTLVSGGTRAKVQRGGDDKFRNTKARLNAQSSWQRSPSPPGSPPLDYPGSALPPSSSGSPPPLDHLGSAPPSSSPSSPPLLDHPGSPPPPSFPGSAPPLGRPRIASLLDSPGAPAPYLPPRPPRRLDSPPTSLQPRPPSHPGAPPYDLPPRPLALACASPPGLLPRPPARHSCHPPFHICPCHPPRSPPVHIVRMSKPPPRPYIGGKPAPYYPPKSTTPIRGPASSSRTKGGNRGACIIQTFCSLQYPTLSHQPNMTL